jgi:ABC transporter substrate binding protein
MSRRAFIAGLVSTAAISCAKAQQMGKTYRIAIAHPSYPASEMNESSGRLPWFPAFFAELRRLGYVEGQNLRVERYSAEGRTAQYADLAREVVSRRPDVILSGKNDMILFLKAATPTIPIVGISADPVAAGIVPSLARPGGNITGVSVDAGLDLGQASRAAETIYPRPLPRRFPYGPRALGFVLRSAPSGGCATCRPQLCWAAASWFSSGAGVSPRHPGDCGCRRASAPRERSEREHRKPRAHLRIGNGCPPAGDVRLSRVRLFRRIDGLRRQALRGLYRRRRANRSDFARNQAGRNPLPASDQVPLRDQPQNRKDARPRNPGKCSRTS